ncbi:hypothetical protein [Methylobacterium nigriterrae]|uniref:hypothetical protein n=1 Tax=Methylobacterium nigriterrae TaxID=3127512 RepID=UPI003013BB0B
MKPSPRLSILTIAALAGLAAPPSRAADGTLPRERPPVALTGAERWALRPAQVGPAAPAARPAPAGHEARAIPEERRNVRMVYPAFVESR